jgi:hypothetical protein
MPIKMYKTIDVAKPNLINLMTTCENKSVNKKNKIHKNPKKEWTHYPIALSRISPFLISSNRAKDTAYKEILIKKGPWGELTKYGPVLTVDDEDILLAILNLAKPVKIKGKETLEFSGHIIEIANLIIKSRPSVYTYNRIHTSLIKFQTTTIHLKVKINNRHRLILSSNIIASIKYNEKTKKIRVVINDEFYKLYIKKDIMQVHTETRLSKLSGKTAKKMYMFIMSHKDNPVWKGQYLKLAEILNINTSQPDKQKKRLIKQAIQELIKNDILDTDQTYFLDNGIVQLWRSEYALPPKINI